MVISSIVSLPESYCTILCVTIFMSHRYMCILCLQTLTVIQIRKTQRDTKGCEFSTAYNYPYLQFDV